ncbi:MAG TPA: PxKF domain-containing protein [Rubrobacter sp.]|nr:PxKF domain-containing protein [Rubrobacter sp.]
MRKSIPMFATTACATTLALILLIACITMGAGPARAANTTYSVENLGALEEDGASIARGVNTSGQVVGQSQERLPNVTPLQLRAFFWDGGPMQDLGTLSGGLTSAGRGINDSGQMVGFSRPSGTTNQQAFVTRRGTDGTTQLEPLGALPGLPSSEAFAINESGKIVGRSSTLPSSGPVRVGRAFLYQDGAMSDLGTLPGASYSEAWAINDRGEVVGESGSDEDHGEAFLYSDGMKALGTLQGYPYSEAFGINDSGRIVGWSYSSRAAVQGRAFLYKDGTMRDLGTLPGDTYSMARAVDEQGRVVGQSRDASGQNRAFLWEDGAMVDLNSLIPPDSPLKLLDAYAISESGQIAGSAFNEKRQVRAFLLTPNDLTPPNTEATLSPEPNIDGWNSNDVTVSLDATDEGGSNVEGIVYSASGAQTVEETTVGGSSTSLDITAEGETTITYAARDHAGNLEDQKTISVRIDRSDPEVSISSPADGAEYALDESVAADYSCSDALSGLAYCLGTVPDNVGIDTASVGQKTFAVEAADDVGNVVSASSIYHVIYDFDGFFSPVDNPDVLNRVRAGSAIPLKFSLGGDQGLDIFAEAGGSGSPSSRPIPCHPTGPTDTLEQTISANPSRLTYDAATDLYTYVWKTRKDWTGCRQLVLRLDDGKEYTADFEFFE